MDKTWVVLVFTLSFVIGYAFFGDYVTNRDMKNKVGYTISDIFNLKDKCEVDLPRNKQCVLMFVAENE